MPRGKLNRRPRRGAKRAKRAKPSGAFRKKVLAVMRGQVETKQAYHTVGPTSYNSGINVIGDATKILPSVTQGTNDAQRIGDQLTGLKLTVKGAIVYNPSTGQYGTFANSRLGVRMMIVQPRQYSNIDDVQSNASAWLSLLLKKGSSTSAFTGILSDLWAPINSDYIIKYYDKVFYMDAPYQATAVGSTVMGNSTRIFKHTMKLRNKVLKYDSSVSSGSQPVNYAPVLLIGYTHMDGSGADTLTTAIQLTYDTIFNYEDA